MLWVSFYRPKGCFAGAFNNFAAWWTKGEFCHCELVLEGTPDYVLRFVQQAYVRHMRSDDPRSRGIVQELERGVMNKRTQRMMYGQSRAWLSFSLLFGDQLRVRALDGSSTDPWTATARTVTDHVVWKSIDVCEDGEAHIINWALEEVAKPYDNTGALCSWMPAVFAEQVNVPRHFCSEFVVRALQRGGHLHAVKASHTTPNRLYDVLQNYIPPYAGGEQKVGLDVDELVERESLDDLAAMMVDSESDSD